MNLSKKAQTIQTLINIEKANEAFNQWKRHKKESIMTYRDNHGYESPITGTKAPPHHTVWKEDCLDDSIEPVFVFLK
jgi:trimethylamine monooxygenase